MKNIYIRSILVLPKMVLAYNLCAKIRSIFQSYTAVILQIIGKKTTRGHMEYPQLWIIIGLYGMNSNTVY